MILYQEIPADFYVSWGRHPPVAVLDIPTQREYTFLTHSAVVSLKRRTD